MEREFTLDKSKHKEGLRLLFSEDHGGDICLTINSLRQLIDASLIRCGFENWLIAEFSLDQGLHRCSLSLVNAAFYLMLIQWFSVLYLGTHWALIRCLDIAVHIFTCNIIWPHIIVKYILCTCKHLKSPMTIGKVMAWQKDGRGENKRTCFT